MLDGIEYIIAIAFIGIFVLGFAVAGLLFAILHFCFGLV